MRSWRASAMTRVGQPVPTASTDPLLSERSLPVPSKRSRHGYRYRTFWFRATTSRASSARTTPSKASTAPTTSPGSSASRPGESLPRRSTGRVRRTSARSQLAESSRLAAMAPPVIVLGVGRSGPTLLRAMLDRNSELALAYASFFVPRLAHRHGGRPDIDEFLDDLGRPRTLYDWGIRPDDVRPRLREGMTTGEAIAAIFETYAERQGK